jgi:hypothetical protein
VAGYLDILAAAYAEAGDFKQAIKFQKQALEFPHRPEAEVDKARQRLKLYEAGKSHRAG